MLLLADGRLAERRTVTGPGGPLAPLLESLAGELRPLLDAPVFIPREKALLSRSGGRCETCGATLAFDPWARRDHRCPSCGRVHTGELHERAWIMPYQLWLAERAVHAALFALLRGDAMHAGLAADILGRYADLYLGYPNRDNVLGPTRLFFSTYLESIWLLNICIATEMLERCGDTRTAGRVRERVVEPARALVSVYDEGMSNRQVWNNAALLAAAALAEDTRAFERVIEGGSGVLAHLTHALLADGSWYEGDNYHQFALRGLWYSVVMLEARGMPLPDTLRSRFNRAFALPFLTALPDFTMPARKDSQYAVPLRQWRIAELAELGFARGEDALIAGALARMYGPGAPPGDTGRARSTADVERHGPAMRLTRADLGWRALLHALPELPALEHVEPRSTLLDAQGYAIFRREGGIYVGIEFGQSGGGHGHPDRLNLTLFQQETRWLDDLGTGSYVDRSLHWYRSTLAHNAPLVNGASQPLQSGELLAWDEREGMGWISASFRVDEPAVRFERAVCVATDYLIDELRWDAEEPVCVDLPWHFPLRPIAEAKPATLDGGRGLEDGFEFLRDVHIVDTPALPTLVAESAGRAIVACTAGGDDARCFTATVPGQPATSRRTVAIVRAAGRSGQLRTIVSWGPAVPDEDGVRYGSGERHRHTRDARGWHVELLAGEARSSIDLAGFRPGSATAEPTAASVRHPMRIHLGPVPTGWLSELPSREQKHLLVYELGEAHYRRSEESWSEAGEPRARVAFGAHAGTLHVLVVVAAGDPRFASPDAENPWDNEHPDTLQAGIQLHARADGRDASWMLVPEPGGGVRVRRISGTGPAPGDAAWRLVSSGYEVRWTLPLPPPGAEGEVDIALDVIINETVAGRDRRRGQLVLSGGRGEFVYLRGDRQDSSRLIHFAIVP